MSDWSGRKVTSARAKLAFTLPTPCYRCNRIVTGDKYQDGDTWDVDHIVSRVDGGEHTVTNYAVSHSRCNRQAGQKVSVQRKQAKKIVRAQEAERTTKFWNLASLQNKIRFFLSLPTALTVASAIFISGNSK